MKPYYQRGDITLYHGDCREVLPSVDPASVALLLADPPYGIDLDTDYWRPSTPRSRSYPPVVGDDGPFDPTPLLRFPRCVLFGANHYADRLPPSRGWLIWDKVTRNDVRAGQISDAEMAWTNCLPRARVFRHMWNGAFRDSERELWVHPTQKPVALMQWVLQLATKPGDLVVDPYMGSGPVAVACLRLGRRYLGVEIVEHYASLAARRLAAEPIPLFTATDLPDPPPAQHSLDLEDVAR